MAVVRWLVVGSALLVVLDTLSPAERLAFVLHDMFALPFEEIAPMIGRTPVAARQLASRARRRVKGAEIPVPDPDLARPRARIAREPAYVHKRRTAAVPLVIHVDVVHAHAGHICSSPGPVAMLLR